MFRWNLRDSDSMGQLMRALGAPEVSAASGGCSEPERAGQRRRAMRAHVMREVSATRRNRMSPWKCTTKKEGRLSCLFCCASPLRGRLHRSRCWRSGSARRVSQAKQYATGILFLTPSSRSAPQKGRTFVLPFLLRFPSTGAALPFALLALRFSSQGLSG